MILIDDIVEYQASEDGRHALFRVSSGGAQSVIAFPEDKLPKLIDAASNAAGQAKRILHKNPHEKAVMAVEWWEFGKHGDQLIMSFRMPGGSEISFAVHQDKIAHMIEVLQTINGQAPPIDPGAKRQ